MKDETLIFYYYNDGLTDAERREVAQALQKDAALADRYRSLSRDLDALRHPADVVVPDGLEHRLITTIQRAARLEASGAVGDAHKTRALVIRPGFFAWGGALTAALALGVAIGLWLAPGDSAEGPGIAKDAPRTSSDTPGMSPDGPGVPQLVLEQGENSDTTWSTVAFQRGLESYFRSGSTNLARLPAEQDTDRSALYAALLNQNRLYAQLALNHDAPDVARVLRSFEPALLLLSSKDISLEEAAILQERLEFEFAVMLTKLSRGSSQQTDNHKQEITL